MSSDDPLPCLLVADDLTGATDTGHSFAERGYRTRVLLDPGAEDASLSDANADVLAISTDSRYLDEAAAAEAVRSAVESHPASVVYKKVDSTLRGNVTAEIGAALEAADATTVVVAPAFPANDRLTACGWHLVEGELVTDTAFGQDEKAPSSAHLPTLLEAPAKEIGHLSIGTVAAGEEAVRNALEGADDRSVIACDAIYEAHLAAIAAGTAPLEPLYAGSAGLAEQIEVPVGADAVASDQPPARSRSQKGDRTRESVLGVVGSVHAATLEALAAMPDERVVLLDSFETVNDPEAAGAAAGERALAALASDGVAIVTAARTDDDIERTMAAGHATGVAPEAVGDRVRAALASAAVAVCNRSHPGGLFLTGGDVAEAVLEGLSTAAIDLTGEEVDAGVPVGHLVGGLADGAGVVTKAGGFGDTGTIVRAIERLELP